MSVCVFYFCTGSCSLAQLESVASLQPEKSISCRLQFTSDAVDFSAHDVYHTHTTFDTSTGVCVHRMYFFTVEKGRAV